MLRETTVKHGDQIRLDIFVSLTYVGAIFAANEVIARLSALDTR